MTTPSEPTPPTRSRHVSRRRVLGGIGAAAAAGIVGPVLFSGAANAELYPGTYEGDPTDPTKPPILWGDLAPAGWNIYSFEAERPELVEAINIHQPQHIRWFVEWDRYHNQTEGGPFVPPVPDWAAYQNFLQALAPTEANPNGIKLHIQIFMFGAFWENQGPEWIDHKPGVQWAKATAFRNIPADIDASYGAFVRSLRDTATNAGVSTTFGAWNEPDQRYQWNGFGFQRVWNYRVPWDTSLGNTAKWSGGTGEYWRALHTTMPDENWTTSMVVEENWLRDTAAIPEIDTIAHGFYFGNSTGPSDMLDEYVRVVGLWDAAAPDVKRPFFVSETSTNYENVPYDDREVARIWQRHNLLSRASRVPTHPLYGRYQGMCNHNPLPWDDPSDPKWAWWKWRPEYATYLEEERPIADEGGYNPVTPPPPPPPPPPPTPEPDFFTWILAAIVAFILALLGIGG